MSIRKLNEPNQWLVRVRTTFEGNVLSRRLTVNGTRQDAQKAEVQLRDELRSGKAVRSLKIGTFSEALSYYRKNAMVDLYRVESLFNRLERDLGSVPLFLLTERFSDYWMLLKRERAERTGNLLTPASRNRLLMYGKVALNFCFKRGLIERNPLACFKKLPEQGRDRILSEEETGRLLEVMKRRNSYLFWPFYFSLRNPIRRGDLCRLTRENLDWFRPWIHFFPSKTKKLRPRETCLVILDEPVLNYFKSLPQGCEYLFPRIDEKGQWHKLGEWKKHWESMLKEAGIENFHWHDLKHCAITWMLDNGYSERDLKNLGIQYTTSMIDRYYKHDASKVLAKWKEQQKNGTSGH